MNNSIINALLFEGFVWIAVITLVLILANKEDKKVKAELK